MGGEKAVSLLPRPSRGVTRRRWAWAEAWLRPPRVEGKWCACGLGEQGGW